MARKAPKIDLSSKGRKGLEDAVAKHTAEQREVMRVKIILLVDEGKENQEIARELNLRCRK